jgi:hypothetical protein
MRIIIRNIFVKEQENIQENIQDNCGIEWFLL